MLGMMQIMIYLLCVYLVFKGFEIFQIAYVSPEDHPARSTSMALGIFAIIIAVCVAVGALFLEEGMARQVQTSMPSFPR